MTREIDRIQEQLQRAYDGDAWYGPPLRTLLADVTPAEAAARPLPGTHTIWEIALHLASWMDAIRRRLETGVAELPAEGDWPPVGPVDEAGWRRALEHLDRREQELRAGMAAVAEERLGDRLPRLHEPPEGPGLSFYGTLHGIVEHNVYHTGQIALLKRALRPG
jgi:uncharacterized damage-inducible protein DinB